MSTKRELVLQALATRLSGISGATVLRGDILPERVPAGGLVIIRDGDPGDPEITMSPLEYHYQHRAEVEVIVQGKTPANRDASFDALCASVGAEIATDRTLGGACDWALPDAPQPADLPIEGAQAIKAAIILVTIYYTTSDPLA